MIYRKLDQNGDYVFGGNQNSYISDAKAVEQAAVTRLRQLIYEWWEDLEDGLPLWQQILASRDKKQATKIIRERLQKTKYVKSILSMETDWDNDKRTFVFRASIDTEFGQIEINEVI